MWGKLKQEVAVDREQIEHLIRTHGVLLDKCAQTEPDAIELSALAAFLHAFYTGSENIFKRIAVTVDAASPGGDAWHRDLLESMACPQAGREPVISKELSERLSEYLAFRHVFRHAYTFHLQWAKMAHLVLECEKTFRRLEAELDSFLESAESKEHN